MIQHHGHGPTSRRLNSRQRRERIRRGQAEAKQYLQADAEATRCLQAYEASIANPRRNDDGTWGVR